MDVSKNNGTPKWMVKIMVPNPIKILDLKVPLLLETTKWWVYKVTFSGCKGDLLTIFWIVRWVKTRQDGFIWAPDAPSME